MSQGGAAVSVAFSRDGRILASSSQEGTVRIWDPLTGDEIGRLSVGEGNATHGVTISPDGHYLAAGDDHAAHIWELGSMRELAHLGHDSPIYGVVFSPDGRYVATTSIDATVGVWDWATGQEVARVAHDAGVFAAAFSPDGRLLATGGDDRTARIWTVDPANLLNDACKRVTRNLTLDEWRLYVHDDTYRKTCPDIP
jgi:WD40 repeat protein